MRLIDADKIEFVLPRTLTEEEKKTFNLVIKKAFENAPTVDAIPIAWLEDQAEDTTFQHRVNGLIERWRKNENKRTE